MQWWTGIIDASVINITLGNIVLCLNDVVDAINQSTALTGVSAAVSGAGAATRILFNSTEYGSDSFVSVEAIDTMLKSAGICIGGFPSLQWLLSYSALSTPESCERRSD